MCHLRPSGRYYFAFSTFFAKILMESVRCQTVLAFSYVLEPTIKLSFLESTFHPEIRGPEGISRLNWNDSENYGQSPAFTQPSSLERDPQRSTPSGSGCSYPQRIINTNMGNFTPLISKLSGVSTPSGSLQQSPAHIFDSRCGVRQTS